MAKNNYKLRLPKGKILQFTPTGKAVPVSKDRAADDRLLREYFEDFEVAEWMRPMILASLRGQHFSKEDLRGCVLTNL